MKDKDDFMGETAGNVADIIVGVLEKDGRIRVYAASGATYQDAVAEAERTGAARRFEQWWVCKR